MAGSLLGTDGGQADGLRPVPGGQGGEGGAGQECGHQRGYYSGIDPVGGAAQRVAVRPQPRTCLPSHLTRGGWYLRIPPTSTGAEGRAACSAGTQDHRANPAGWGGAHSPHPPGIKVHTRHGYEQPALRRRSWAETCPALRLQINAKAPLVMASG